MTTITARLPGTPAPAEINRLGAREAARQAALLRVPGTEGTGRLIADPAPRFAQDAEATA